MREKQRELAERINKMPCVIIFFAAANIAIFLLTDFMGDTQSAEYIERWGGMFPPRIYGEGQYWRLLSSCFLHYGADHLTNNMVLLCCVGSRVEKLTGHWKTLTIYLLSGICGSLLSCLAMISKGEYAVSAGASGWHDWQPAVDCGQKPWQCRWDNHEGNGIDGRPQPVLRICLGWCG